MEVKKYLSLGMGVQSTWLYYASTFGYIPRVEAAIFADLGREKSGTLKYLDFLLKWADENSDIPIIVIRGKNLYKDLLNSENSTGGRFASIPAFTKNDDGTKGMLRRQCTNEYKIEQVDRAIRTLCGIGHRKRMPNPIELYKGISLDEIERLSIPQEKWKIQVYPFCGYVTYAGGKTNKTDFEYKRTRTDILNEYTRHNLPIPPKSTCVFCPYQSEKSWSDMKHNEPEDFAAAVEVDEAIRNSSKKGIKNPIFLHDSMKPLKDIQFSKVNDLWKGECSGECHI